MKEKTLFLCVILATVLIFSSRVCFAGSNNYKSYSSSGGEMKSEATGSKTTTTGALSGPKGFLTARQGGNRQFKWVTSSGKTPGDRSARGALDGSSYSSKDNTFTTTVLSNTVRVGQEINGERYGVYKTFLSFDTTGIPQNANNISAKLVFYGKRKVLTSGSDFTIHIFKSVYEEPLWNSDWGAIIGPPLEKGELYASALSTPSDPNASSIDPDSCRNELEIDDPISLINKGGITKIALVSDNTFAGLAPSGQEYVELYSPNATKQLRPRLEISYDGNPPDIKPVLTWVTGDTYFKDTGAWPDTINAGQTEVNFKVRYVMADANGESGSPPAVAQVLIDKNSDGDYDDPGEQVDMTKDSGDSDFSDGVIYTATVPIVSTGQNIRYQFLFKPAADSEVEATGTPATAHLITAVQAPKNSSDNKLCFISSLRR